MIRYGWGIQHLTHWAVPFVGNGLIAFGAGSIPSIGFTYCKSLFLYIPETSGRFLLSDCIRRTSFIQRLEKRICFWILVWYCPVGWTERVWRRFQHYGRHSMWRDSIRTSALVLWKTYKTCVRKVEGYQLVNFE